jgi:hypothetical protein
MDHDAGRQCLLEMDDVLKMVGVPYFLMQGTALGAYRDKGFVPTERDIDIGVLYENLRPNAVRILVYLMSRGFDVEAFTMPFDRPKTLVAFKAYQGNVAKVDIVGMVKWQGVRFTSTPVRPYIAEPYALVHKAEAVENYRKVPLFGREFNIPLCIEQYLEAEYGPDWKTPADDHVSRTRFYNFLESEGIPRDYLARF